MNTKTQYFIRAFVQMYPEVEQYLSFNARSLVNAISNDEPVSPALKAAISAQMDEAETLDEMKAVLDWSEYP